MAYIALVKLLSVDLVGSRCYLIPVIPMSVHLQYSNNETVISPHSTLIFSSNVG